MSNMETTTLTLGLRRTKTPFLG